MGGDGGGGDGGGFVVAPGGGEAGAGVHGGFVAVVECAEVEEHAAGEDDGDGLCEAGGIELI